MLSSNQIQQYQDTGWLWIRDALSDDFIKTARTVGQELAAMVHTRVGKPSPHGSSTYWKGVPCASAFNSKLLPLYRSELMYDLSHDLLGQSYLYNDQIVYKMPLHQGQFFFEEHYDNQFGPNVNNEIHTVNFSWVLDDFNEQNGPIEVYDQNQYRTLLAKAGDIIAIRGDTYHRSAPNTTTKPRGVYACVYTQRPILFENFYSEKFTEYTEQHK